MNRSKLFASLRHGNLAFDVMTCAVIGAATLGLYFFAIDVIEGRPLYTPMLLGSLLFRGEAVLTTVEVELLPVAGYTFVHLMAFAVIGLGASLLAHYAEHAKDPAVAVAIGVFALEVASFTTAAFVFPEALEYLSGSRIAVANVLAAAAITVYFVRYRKYFEYEPESSAG